MKTAKAHNGELTGSAEALPSRLHKSRTSVIPDALRHKLAIECKRLEADMWERLHRHADIADFRVVIDRLLG
jgi:hypothetical protein